MDITRVGFGAWAVGGGDYAFGWGPQDDADSLAAIRRAIESGVNWIDTAAIYGLGRSEEVVGRALRDFPEADRPYVFTKCGMVWDSAGGRGDPSTPARRLATPASIRREVDDSLRRLGVERLDLYQVHQIPAEGDVDTYWPTMLDLRREGKVRAVGLSNHDVPRLRAAQAIGQVDSLQPPFSLINRAAAADVIPWCQSHGTGVIVYSPMQSGLLTGAFSRERVRSLPSDDWRRRSPDFGAGLDANLAVAAALEPIAAEHGVSVAAIAVAWTIAFPGVTGAIVGARRAEQVDDWIAAADLQLSRADIDSLADALARTGAGRGPTSPRGTEATGNR